MADIADNLKRIKKKAASLGFSLSGVADIREVRASFLLAAGLRDSFPLAVSLGLRLSDAVLEDIRDAPTPLYFHHYRQVNAFLDRGALLLAGFIQDLGCRALPIPASQIIDWDGQRGHVSHKEIARRAGLGWIGRNNLLVTPEFGSRLRLVTILTDLPLPAAAPQPFGCGDCRACLAPCPGGSIKERPEDFDHKSCYEKLKEFRRAGLASQYICGICVKACRGRSVRGRRGRAKS